MADVDTTPISDALVEIIAVFAGVLIAVADRVLWALWNEMVRMLSVDHLGQTPAIIFFILGLLFCMWFYVMKFVVE